VESGRSGGPAPSTPLPLQLKFWNWGYGGKCKYLAGTRLLVTHFPSYNGPFRATLGHIAPSVRDGDVSIQSRSILSFEETIVQIHSEEPPLPTLYAYEEERESQNGAGETPSPPFAAGDYFRYPRPDTGFVVKPPHSSDRKDILLPFTASHSGTTDLSPVVTLVTKDDTRGVLAPPPRRETKSTTSRSYRSYNINSNSFSPGGGRGRRTAKAHGGRGKPTNGGSGGRRSRFFDTDFYLYSNPQIQDALRRVGIDEFTVLQRDRRVRLTCCREDARYIFLVFKIRVMLIAFEEVTYFAVFLFACFRVFVGALLYGEFD